MNQKSIVLTLASLIAILSVAGAWSGNVAVLTMAASVIAGMFAFLQVNKD